MNKHEKLEYSEDTFAIASLSTTNSTWNGLGLNPGLRGECRT